MADPIDALDSLSSSLDDLEEILEPLFSKSFDQTQENLQLEQRAKLQVVLAYTIQDLVLIFLKSKGLDPSKHPVSEELKRVKSYFDKIKEAENPATRTLTVDRAAANRFIRAAISEAKAASLEAQEEAVSAVASPSTTVGRHTRFTHTTTSGSSKVTVPTSTDPTNNHETDNTSSSDSDLEIVDGYEPPPNEGPGDKQSSEPRSIPNAKRRRMADPFAGYSADASETFSSMSGRATTNSNGSRKRHKNTKTTVSSS